MVSRSKANGIGGGSMGEGFWLRNIEISYKLSKKKSQVTSATVSTMYKYFDRHKFPRPTATEVTAAINSTFAGGDIIKGFYLLRYYQVSQQGLFITNESIDKSGSEIRYIGAENWESVMCYMDALLFAMFANLDSFEPILFLSNSSNVMVQRLSNLLRVYVNLLRSGNLIKLDLTVQICETLYKLGFTEALSHKQQDAATLFEFLTEILSMPLLTFKIDIQHGGKFNQEDDRKYSKERMLFVSLPEDLADTESSHSSDSIDNDILLEECLEHYFNNSISVKRELERRATLESFPSFKGSIDLVENIDDHSILSESPSKNSAQVIVRTRSSTLSIWTNSEEPKNDKSKEVSLPAWMFLRLLPFYTDDNDVSINNGNLHSTAKSSKEFAKRRPVLPICLKRYSFENQKANRLQRKVIIPPVINLPSFVADDLDDSKSSESYKLILESAICHRGTSISSGHFVSAIRKNYHNLHETDDDAYNATWYLYDDLHKPKVMEKSFKEIFNTEWPYILFYRLVSFEESGSSAVSTLSSVTSSPKVIVPQGSKGKYWQEEPSLSPIISATNSSKDTSSMEAFKKTMTSLNSSSSSASSLDFTLPDVSPLDSKYVDIRDRYYWFVPDKDKNYYKEDSISSQNSRKPSLTAPFRKNSQWSDQDRPKFTMSPNDDSTLNSPVVKTPKRSASVPIGYEDLENTISHMSLNDSTSRVSDPVESKTKTHKHRHLLHHHHDEINKSYKKSRKKRDAYKKEKCIVM